jgi:hypothetical protein
MEKGEFELHGNRQGTDRSTALAGEVAVVTGASRGVGKGISRNKRNQK